MTNLLSRLKRQIRLGLRRGRKAPETGDPSDTMIGNSRIRIGRFTYGKRGLGVKQWDEGASLTIGSFCSIAPGVTILLGGNHRTDWITTFPFGHVFRDDLGPSRPVGHPATRGDVTIGHDVWLGYNSTILSGVTIGSGAVVAANATVTRDIPPYEIWGGNPARRLSARFDNDTIARLLALEWWHMPLEDIRRLVPELSAPPAPEMLDRIMRVPGA